MTSIDDVFVSPQWLNDRIGQSDIRIVDGSWYMPASKRDPRNEFENAHIASAVFFDQDSIVDPTGNFPHTLPSAEIFAAAVGKLGIDINDDIVIYETGSLFAAPRVWWLFHIMGAKRVRILKGGLAAWQSAGYTLENSAPIPIVAVFDAQLDAQKVVMINELVLLCKAGGTLIVDARANDRFLGTVAEPRAGVRSGSIPGSVNVPFGTLIEDGELKPLEVIREVFEAQGIMQGKSIITTCGSGVTAAVLFLALSLLGYETVRLYDGSWTEWGTLT